MLSFGIKTIFLLILTGAIIALIGDYIGRAIGRKRLSFLKLRPRHTAFAFTAVTGIIITLITIGIILPISKDARLALFGLNKLQKDLFDKTELLEKTKKELSNGIKDKELLDKELKTAKLNLIKSKNEIAVLEKIKEKLGKEVEASRQGKVLFSIDETILTSVIQAGPERDKIEKGLKQILAASNYYSLSISPNEFEKAIKILMERRGENIVIAKALRNTLFGENVPVRLEIEKNQIVYRIGEDIADIAIPPSLSVPEIEQEIKKLLNLTHQVAREAGIIPNPSGTLGSIPYSEIFALAQKIKSTKKQIQLRSEARSNIYKSGPLDINFKIYYL